MVVATGTGAARRGLAAEMRRLLDGYQVTLALHAAAVLGIPDLLRDGPRTNEDLAAASGAHAPTLYRLLRALAAIGVLHEDDGRRFGLTPLGATLCADAPDSQGPRAVQVGQAYYWGAWARLPDSVRTGENAFRLAHGQDIWAYRASHPEEGAAFERAMAASSAGGAAAVLDAYDFGRFGAVVDVGGGRGTLLAAILARHPHVRGVLLDQPHVVAGARGVLGEAVAAGRCDLVGGSFFEAVPAGDAHVLRMIVHDWEDAEAVAILRRCRETISDDGRLLLVERVIAPPNEGATGKFGDLSMLVGPGGRERTRAEYAALLGAAGFRLLGVAPTASGFDVLEAAPVTGEAAEGAA